ncbi:MAG: hypothetical protein HOJ54_10910, partial [Phycisphaerae bacterium]|nr:hypothetical protein [Phycisphaerae bacterium]
MTTQPCELHSANEDYLAEAATIKLGGGDKGIARQHRHGRLTARERIE